MALKGNQKKLDKNNNNRIDAQDFKILKAEKSKAKPMKAALGAIALGIGAKKMMDKNKISMPAGMGAAALLAKKKKEILGKKRGGGIKKDPTKPVNPFEKKSSKFMERRKKLGRAGSMLGKAGRIGLLGAALGVAGAGAAKLGQTIGRKMSEKKNKKMGGGMMKRPMGYTKGGGADTGTIGEAKSKLATGIDAFKRRLKKEKLQAPKRGPMKPLKAKKGRSISTRGGGVDSGTFGRIRDAGPFRRIPTTPPGGFKPMGPETSQRLKKLIDRKNRREKIKDVVRQASQLLPGVGAIGLGKRVFEKFGGQKQEPREKGERPSRRGRMGQQRSKPDASRNPNPKTPKMMGAMGGGMMNKPMGYKSGTSVKVKCKLGRNKPTKMY